MIFKNLKNQDASRLSQGTAVALYRIYKTSGEKTKPLDDTSTSLRVRGGKRFFTTVRKL